MNCTSNDKPRFSALVRARSKTADATAADNVAAINERIPDEASASLTLRLKALMNSTAPVWIRLRGLYALVAELDSYSGGNVACKRGCAHCCHIAVAVTPVEAEMIGAAIRRKPKQNVASAHRDYSTMEYGYHTPCTFLKNGECSIYEHRPLHCRTLINADVDGLLCELTPPPGPLVPYLDRTSYQAAYVGICRTFRSADIRDYFPPDSK